MAAHLGFTPFLIDQDDSKELEMFDVRDGIVKIRDVREMGAYFPDNGEFTDAAGNCIGKHKSRKQQQQDEADGDVTDEAVSSSAGGGEVKSAMLRLIIRFFHCACSVL